PSPNATQTSHSTFCADSVVHARKATNAKAARTTRTRRDMAPLPPPRLPSRRRGRYCCAMLTTGAVRRVLGALAALALTLAQAAPLSARSVCAEPAHHSAHHGSPAGGHASNNSAPAHSTGCRHCPPADCATQPGCAVPLAEVPSRPVCGPTTCESTETPELAHRALRNPSHQPPI